MREIPHSMKTLGRKAGAVLGKKGSERGLTCLEGAYMSAAQKRISGSEFQKAAAT